VPSLGTVGSPLLLHSGLSFCGGFWHTTVWNLQQQLITYFNPIASDSAAQPPVANHISPQGISNDYKIK